jgi:hypothetical protein
MTACAGFRMLARFSTLVVILALACTPCGALAQARRATPAPRPAAPPPAPVGVETSPIVTVEPYGPGGGGPTRRALTAAERTRVRQQADAFYTAVLASASFTSPMDVATLVTTDAVITPEGALNQSLIAYWSQPRDVRRRSDGSLAPKLGGAHRLLYFETNDPPNAESLFDRDQNSFVRRATGADVTDVWFPFPKVQGEIAGGVVYTDYLIFTRDGGPALEPAPIGPLIEQEIARLREYTKGLDTTRALQELEASMTPEAKAARRARREEVWKKETKDPLAMARRLDAADRTDESDYQRQKADKTPPPETSAAARDPRNWYWGTRLALTQLETMLNTLDTAGRGAPACARLDTAFPPHAQMRYAIVVGGQPVRGCVPMAQVRKDLVEPGRPTSEVQLLTVWFRESRCGAKWNEPPPATPAGRGDLCDGALPLLREMDWAAVQRAFGWPER